MKSRRVSKLLALGLAVSMFSTPVYATTKDLGTADLGKDTTVNATFDIAETVVKVTVPTSIAVRVQPLGDGVGTTVSQSTVASKDFKIINQTYMWTDEEKTAVQGVPVKVTAKAKITQTAQGVTAYFDKNAPEDDDDRFSDMCEKKNIWMQLREGTYDTPSSNSSNISYTSAEASTITPLGSKIIFTVSGPSVVSAGDVSGSISEANTGKAAMAIIGTAAKNAKWAKSDVTASVTYSIQTTGGTAPQTNDMGTGMTATNDGLVTIPEETLNGCTITGLAVQNAKDNSYGVQQLKLENIEKDTTVTSGMQFTIKSGVMSNINSVKNVKTNVLVGLDDGRVLIADFVTPNN